jgi:hypothetical protein
MVAVAILRKRDFFAQILGASEVTHLRRDGQPDGQRRKLRKADARPSAELVGTTDKVHSL